MFSLICLNKRSSKQSRGWRFETPSCSLWRHCMLQIRHDSFKLGLWKILRTFSPKRRYFLTGRWDPEEYRSTYKFLWCRLWPIACSACGVWPLTHSLFHSPTHPPNHALTHPPTLTHALTHTHSLTHSDSINQSFTHSSHWFTPTHPHPHSLTHWLTHPSTR